MVNAEKLQRALQEIQKGHARYQYFFDRLESSEWLEPLQRQGFFGNPPPPVREQPYISFPLWPESRYLARMAKLQPAQERVLEIALKIPETENVRVHEDLADVALALPAKLAAKLVPSARQWIKSPHKLLMPEKISDLIVQLAEGGEASAALDLARAVLALSPDATASDDDDAEEDGLRLSPEPQALFDDWHYDRILVKVIPILVKSARTSALELVCKLLNDAIRFSRRRSTIVESSDFSYIWHPAIEEDERPARLKNSLISAARNASELLVQLELSDLGTVLGVLRSQPWSVFRRIEIHLIRKFIDLAKDEVGRVIEDVFTLEDRNISHEAALLLKTAFPSLSTEQRDRILTAIDAGPDPESVEMFVGHDPTEQRVQQFSDNWRRQRLELLEGMLPKLWADRYEELKRVSGGGRRLDEVRRSETWVGPVTPKSQNELTTMGPDAVIEFLKSWEPPGGTFDATPEGLGRILAEVIKLNPEQYAGRAEKFRGADPTYVRFLFQGLTEALKEGRTFEWRSVLDLTNWVVGQAREIEGRQADLMEADPDWGWCRGTIADLLAAGLENESSQIVFEMREVVWKILVALTNDPDPTPQHEAKYSGSNIDPATMSINTVRGKAFHALISYALWVRRCLDNAAPDGQRPRLTMDVMPEVRTVLEAHLDTAVDPALTIRSVYGHYFPWFVFLDFEWANGLVTRIFPKDEEQHIYFQAAWESYLVFSRPYWDVLPLLVPQYQRAITQLHKSAAIVRHPADPEPRLAEHLMTCYWAGKVQLRGDDGLVQGFFENASDQLRAHAIAFIGQSLANTNGSVPPDVLSRLEELWNFRLKGTGAATSSLTEFKKELASFGWWFISGKFDEEWSLRQLLSVLDLTRKVEPNFEVVKKLAGFAKKFPLESVQCLRRIVEDDKEGWTILGLREHAEAILATALVAGSPDAQAAARLLIEHLIARGYFEFRNLLP